MKLEDIDEEICSRCDRISSTNVGYSGNILYNEKKINEIGEIVRILSNEMMHSAMLDHADPLWSR